MVYKKVDMERVRHQATEIRLLGLDVDGVLTDGRLHIDTEGREHKIFHARDGFGLRQVLEAGIEIAIISGRSSPAVMARMVDLGISEVHLGQRNKLPVIKAIMKRMKIDFDAVAYVGDDVPDVEIMKQAGLAVAVADAHPELDAIADWHTSLGGGYGAVREVCDLLLAAQAESAAR